MARGEDSEGKSKPSQRPIVWLNGEIKTPPFSDQGRREAGFLLRRLQNGDSLGMPHFELLPVISSRCGALRVRDKQHNWRIICRLDSTAVLIVDIYDKKSRKVPDEVIDRCKKRLITYDEEVEGDE